MGSSGGGGGSPPGLAQPELRGVTASTNSGTHSATPALDIMLATTIQAMEFLQALRSIQAREEERRETMALRCLPTDNEENLLSLDATLARDKLSFVKE